MLPALLVFMTVSLFLEVSAYPLPMVHLFLTGLPVSLESRNCQSFQSGCTSGYSLALPPFGGSGSVLSYLVFKVPTP